MNKISRGILWIILLLVMSSEDGLKAQWSEVQNITGPEGQRIGAICFKDGIAWAGATSLFTSTDTGKTWIQSQSFQASEISDIAFFDSLNGLVGTFSSGVFLTQDGGQSWNNVIQANAATYNRVAFNGSASVMHVLENNESVLSTSTDGGNTWSLEDFGGEGMTFAIGKDKTIYVLTSGNGSWVNYSTDFGSTWSGNGANTDIDSQGLAADSCDINKLYLINENTKDRTPTSDPMTKIEVTPDQGQTWQTDVSHKLDYYSGSIANTAQVVYITTDAGGNGVLRSTDAGASWQSIGGPMCYFDTRSVALANNNIVLVLDSLGNIWTTLNSGGDSLNLAASGPGVPTLVLSGNPQQYQSSLCGPMDTSVFLGVISCLATTATLDSVTLSGSSAFSLTNAGSFPRSVVTDSIPLSFWAKSSGADTALLLLSYHLAGIAHDTTILLLGKSSGDSTSHPAGAQEEVSSTSYGQTASLPLIAHVASNISIDLVWGYLKSIDAEFDYDSSKLTFSSYDPPPGWSTVSVNDLGNKIDIKIQYNTSNSTQPLNLGTANFIPRLHTGSLTTLPLIYLVLNTSGGQVPLCIDRQEDDIWAVKVYPTSDVAVDVQSEQDIQVFPNPADNELWIQNSVDAPAFVVLSDALGRELLSTSIPENSTGKLDLESLASSSYILTCHVNDRTFIRRVAKLR